MKKTLIAISLIAVLISISSASIAEENKQVDPVKELKAASDYFYNHNIGEFNSDIRILFDPSNQFDKRDIERWNIPRNIYSFVGSYWYKDGGSFELRVFGETVAKNDVETDGMESTIVVPLVPLPGGIMCNEFILDKYRLDFRGVEEVDGYKCNIIRLDAIDMDNEFFDFVEYYIDKNHKVIRKVRAKFDYGIWRGSGNGEFYYTKRDGILLPSVGKGWIMVRGPYQASHNLWGRWSGIRTRSLDELSQDDVEQIEDVKE